MRRYLRAFIAGSAFPVLIWPFLYLGIPFTLNPQSGFQMGLTAIFLPFVYGFTNILTIFLQKRWPPKNLNSRMLTIGALLGLVLSLLGNFMSNIPTNLFLLQSSIRYITIPLAILMYALIWRYIVKNLNKIFGL